MKEVTNICAGIIISACLISLLKDGYNIYPAIIIALQVAILILNNFKVISKI